MLVRIMWVSLLLAGAAIAAPEEARDITFHRDVLPILQQNCQKCHRPGEVAPMSLLTFEEVRPWARAIKEAVLLKRMPPWFADPRHGEFSNERTLSGQETEAIATWVEDGAKEGNPADAPAPLEFVHGWNIGAPDLVVEMPHDFHVPAEGTIDYQYVILPRRFTEDIWVRALEVRPGNREVVHHINVFVRPRGSQWLADAVPGEVFVPREYKRDANAQRDERRDLIAGLAPGTEAAIFPEGYARLIRAGSEIVFQLHYTANGKAATDRSKIGFVLAEEKPVKRIETMLMYNNDIVIPPGEPNHEIKATLTMPKDVELISLLPHMHLRGKNFRFDLVYPDGRNEVLLNVPNYNFNWQYFYTLASPKVLPKGTKIHGTAHFDNSPNNPANPDPSKEVRWGDQSWEEMMSAWFDVAVQLEPDVSGQGQPPKADGAGE